MGSKGKWCVQYGLSEPSFPVHPKAKLAIQAHSSPPCATQRPLILDLTNLCGPMVPEGYVYHSHSSKTRHTEIYSFTLLLWQIIAPLQRY